MTVYKYYRMSLQKHSLEKPNVLLITREPINGNLPGRDIENLSAVRTFFKKNNRLYDYSEKKMELLEPAKQVETMVNTDIFIGALGSGFANVIFMIPGSVIISYSPPHIGGFFFQTMAEFARVRYLAVFNNSVPYPPECKNRVNGFGESVVRSCVDVLYQENVYIEIEQLKGLLSVSLVHLKSVKYK